MLVAFGLLIHVVFLLSIFDIYFKSPIVEGVPPFEPIHDAPAKRVVLIVTDGLRAESFLNYYHTPYLRFVASTKGIWGVSNTRVPTESRPGHVAIIGGFYEDPSAVAKGWKKNPVNFDNIFNQSRYSWCWGAEDVLDIFSPLNKSEGRIFMQMYKSEEINFGDTNTSLLDAWVFERVEQFFIDARSDQTLMNKLMNDKIVFFLHLLGLDTAGHTHKPNTEKFIATLKHADEGLSKIIPLIEKFYNDNKTAFIVTSDHGMTDWGSHGAGDDHETQTPYIAWGAGIRQQISNDSGFKHGLPKNRRFDMKQADFAPLMATLISVPVPVNSVGHFHWDVLDMPILDKTIAIFVYIRRIMYFIDLKTFYYRYYGELPSTIVDVPTKDLAKAIYSNARQLAAQYDRKRELIEANAIKLFYKPFLLLTKHNLNKALSLMEKKLEYQEYSELGGLSETLATFCLDGLIYYYNYYQTFLLICISSSFLGWMANIVIKLMFNSSVECRHGKSGTNVYIDCIAAGILIGGLYVIIVQQLPLQYVTYVALPIVLWWRVITTFEEWESLLVAIIREYKPSVLGLKIFLYIMNSVALVASFTYRSFLILPLIGMAIWPLYLNKVNRSLLFVWITTCFGLATFSYMPVVGKDTKIYLVITSGIIYQALSVLAIRKAMKLSKSVRGKTLSVFVTQALLLSMALLIKGGFDYFGTPMAWIVSAISLMMPLLSGYRQFLRLPSIFTAIYTVYTLLSVAHEALFFVTLIVNLSCWLLIECRDLKMNKLSFALDCDDKIAGHRVFGLATVERRLSEQDFRRSFFFLVYMIISFFGTGNIASINSFEVRWVLCFVTSFRPFVITFLVLCKTIFPFLAAACVFRALNVNTRAPTGHLILIVLIFCDMMGLQFLFLVKNFGSWLEIGTSISQYVISQTITLLIVLLYILAHVYTMLDFTNSRKKYA